MPVRSNQLESPRNENHDAVLQHPLESLGSAINSLRGACSKLQSSVEGVNSHLEDTNRRLAEALKIRSETAAYLEAVLKALPTGVIVVDRDGCIVYWSPEAEKITGFEASEMNGHRYSETVGSTTPHRQTPLYTLATGYVLSQVEKTIVGKSGEVVPVSSSTALLGRGAALGAIEAIIDLRKMKALEEEVDRVRTLAAEGELAAVIAQEVRNPLGGIRAFVDLLERDLETNPEHLALVVKVQEGIEALERVVEDLLEAGRSIRLVRSHTELGAEARKVVEVCSMAAQGEGKHIEFEVSTPPLPVYCRVDPLRIRQALTSLVRNAVEASGMSGKVTVVVRVRNGKKSSAASCAGSRAGYIAIDVTDNGPDVPTDFIDKRLTPFFTTRRVGIGLGLHAARRIAGLHGGTVDYTRPASGGSTFTMTLPRW
jgi:two-component system nitrogen regulation sensor histidine kinase GlnL